MDDSSQLRISLRNYSISMLDISNRPSDICSIFRTIKHVGFHTGFFAGGWRLFGRCVPNQWHANHTLLEGSGGKKLGKEKNSYTEIDSVLKITAKLEQVL